MSTCKENGCALVTAGDLVEIQTRMPGRRRSRVRERGAFLSALDED